MKKLALTLGLALATTPAFARGGGHGGGGHEDSTGVESTPDAASVVMFIVVAIVTSMEAAAMATGTMATGTTDVMAIIMDTAAVIPAAAIGLGILGGVLGGIP